MRVKGLSDAGSGVLAAVMSSSAVFFSEPPVLKPEQFIEVASPFLCAVKINDGQKPELYAP